LIRPEDIDQLFDYAQIDVSNEVSKPQEVYEQPFLELPLPSYIPDIKEEVKKESPRVIIIDI
jgi:hypothetical protein